MTGPVLALAAARVQYRRSSLDAYVELVMAGLRDDGSPVAFRPFGAAVRRLPLGDGTLPCRSRVAAGPAFTRLTVDEAALARVAALGEAEGDGAGPVSYREAAILLGVPEPTVSWIVAAGLLATTGDHDRSLIRDAIRRFDADYALTAEVARRLGVPPPRLEAGSGRTRHPAGRGSPQGHAALVAAGRGVHVIALAVSSCRTFSDPAAAEVGGSVQRGLPNPAVRISRPIEGLLDVVACVHPWDCVADTRRKGWPTTSAR